MEEHKTGPPVTDVMRPKTQTSAAPPHLQPDAVHEAPPPEKTGEEPKHSAPVAPPAASHKDKSKAAHTAKPKEAGDKAGVGMAITATVVIVLGLAAMATYAYLKTQ